MLVDRKIHSDKYTAYVGADNYEIGRHVGRYIAERLQGEGNLVEVTGLRGSTSALERHRGLKDALKATPGIKIIASADAAWLKESAEVAFDSILSRYPHIDMVLHITTAWLLVHIILRSNDIVSTICYLSGLMHWQVRAMG